MATLSIPPVLTSPREDAMQLFRAFKGFGCDTASVVNILTRRDATQRAFIEQEYLSIYSEDLTKRLSSELSGDVKKAVLIWMPGPALKDATIVREALAGDKLDLRAATEVICSRTPSQLQQLKQIYNARFHAYIEHDLERQATGDLKKLLLAYVSIARYEGPETDKQLAEHDAKSLFHAGEKMIGTDEDTFIRIFSQHSRAQLVAVASAYHKVYADSLEKAIKGETSGLFRFALLTILQCAENSGKYFAKVLHKAMKGMGTDDSTLTRVLVTRAEIDTVQIKAEYAKKYGKTLNDAIHSETSGHYRTFLLSLLGATQR